MDYKILIFFSPLIVFVAAKSIHAPGPVAYFEAIPLGSSALYLIWKRPTEPNGLLTGYNIYYREVIGTELGEERERTPQITDPRETRAKLAGLKPKTKYRIDICATTSKGQGEKKYIEVQTNDLAEQQPDEPYFVWSRLPNADGKAGVRVTWVPALAGHAGNHFFVQYRKKGESTWVSSPPEENQDYIFVQGLELGSLYEMKVVAVDGPFQTSSKVEEIETGGMDEGDRVMQNPELFEGDILGYEPGDDRNAVVEKHRVWPNGRIPYIIDPKLKLQEPQIKEAMQHYADKTCIRFVPRTDEIQYVKIFPGKGCYSHVGKTLNDQPLSLGAGCFKFGIIVHELGHAVGFFHEHSRSDRDDYLNIHRENIAAGFESQFVKLRPKQNQLLTPFDYDSVMLYGETVYSRSHYDGLKTMTAKDGRKLQDVTAKPGLSESDIQRIKMLYKC